MADLYLLPPANEDYVFTAVCEFVHGVGGLPQCMLGYHPPGAGTIPNQTPTPPRSRHTPREQTPPRAVHPGRYGQQAGGMHPTGMQSCFFIVLEKYDVSGLGKKRSNCACL